MNISTLTFQVNFVLSTEALRGGFLSLYALMIGLGILLSYCLGASLYWRIVSCLPPLLYTVLACGLFRIPESPIWLLAHKGPEEARQSLQWLRDSDDVETELDNLKATKEKQDHGLTLKEAFVNLFTRPDVRKPFLIVTTNFFLVMFSGPIIVIFYSVEIFMSAGIDVSEFVAAILTAVLRVLGGLFGTLLVQKLPRVRLAMAGITMMSLSMMTLGVVFYLKDQGCQHPVLNGLPVAALTLYNFSFGAGKYLKQIGCY